MDTDALVRDYLGRLQVAATSLPAPRREELTGEVRDHIAAAIAQAGRSDEVTVRNILERLGAPEDIVASEVTLPVTPDRPGTPRTGIGAVEVASLLMLGLAWPALLLRDIGLIGPILWLGMGIVGLVLVQVSNVWSKRRKLIITTLVVALYAAYLVVTTPVRVESGPVGGSIEEPVVSSTP